MAARANEHGFDAWMIASADGSTSASIVPALGAIVSSLVLPAPGGARDVLFRHDHFWDGATSATRGGIPFLFPICGRLLLDGEPGCWRHEGRTLRLPLHGFAMRRPWVVIDPRRADELAVGMIDGPDTQAGYPFPFELLLRFRVQPGRFTCALACTNRGDRPMPYSVGFHPYFLTPPLGPDKDRVSVSCSAKQRLCYDETYTVFKGAVPAPDGAVTVRDPLFRDSITVLDPPGPAEVAWPDGFALRVSARGETDPEMFPFLQLHTEPDKPYVCAEPWSGVPNALNTGYGLRWLAPGAVERAVFTVTVVTPLHAVAQQPG